MSISAGRNSSGFFHRIAMLLKFFAGHHAIVLVGIRLNHSLEYHDYFLSIFLMISTALRNPSRSALSGVPSVACFPQI